MRWQLRIECIERNIPYAILWLAATDLSSLRKFCASGPWSLHSFIPILILFSSPSMRKSYYSSPLLMLLPDYSHNSFPSYLISSLSTFSMFIFCRTSLEIMVTDIRIKAKTWAIILFYVREEPKLEQLFRLNFGLSKKQLD